MSAETSVEPGPAALMKRLPHSARRVLVCGPADDARDAAIEARDIDHLVSVAPPLKDMSALESVEGPFDCILCDDTIARLREPEPMLTRFHALLAPGGLLVLTAPNLQYHKNVEMLAEGRWEFSPCGAIARKHLRFFTGRELQTLLDLCGFDAARCSALTSDPPEAFARDADDCVRRGRFTFGPLNNATYPLWLTRVFVMMALKHVDA